jgi:hypothetical protein
VGFELVGGMRRGFFGGLFDNAMNTTVFFRWNMIDMYPPKLRSFVNDVRLSCNVHPASIIISQRSSYHILMTISFVLGPYIYRNIVLSKISLPV